MTGLADEYFQDEIELSNMKPTSSRKLDLLSVVLPAHNEARSVAESLPRLAIILSEYSFDHEIILVADGCSDETVAVAEKLDIPSLVVIEQWPRAGKGSALRKGVGSAAGDAIALFDADLDIHPSSLEKLLEIYLSDSSLDVVVGSKVHPESTVSYPVTRRILSGLFRRVSQMLFGLPVADTQTGVKLFRAKALHESLQFATDNGFAFDLQLLVAANDAGYSIIEGPVVLDFQSDTRVRLVDGLDALRAVARLAIRRRKDLLIQGNQPG